MVVRSLELDQLLDLLEERVDEPGAPGGFEGVEGGEYLHDLRVTLPYGSSVGFVEWPPERAHRRDRSSGQ